MPYRFEFFLHQSARLHNSPQYVSEGNQATGPMTSKCYQIAVFNDFLSAPLQDVAQQSAVDPADGTTLPMNWDKNSFVSGWHT